MEALFSIRRREGISDGRVTLDLCAKAALDEEIDVGESGTTLRFLIPFAMDGRRHVFRGRGRVLERPMTWFSELAEAQHILWEMGEDGLVVCGRLKPGLFSLSTKISSQFASAMMLYRSAHPEIELSIANGASDAPGRQYLEMTEEVIKAVDLSGETVVARCPEDASNAAFFAAASAMGIGEQPPSGLCYGSQTDMDFAENFKDLYRSTCIVDLRQHIDMAPVAAAVAASGKGEVLLYGLDALRWKESDRLAEMARVLMLFGKRASLGEVHGTSAIRIFGSPPASGRVELFVSDHRIAHLALLLGAVHRDEVWLGGADSLSKSHMTLYRWLRERLDQEVNDGISHRT